ncbi:hypothetical protein Tco_0705192 [Tanacetum coccineum]|uniref:Uncharacterized protein n=1 Tax=Tanacetum coccineum TaxID=301880 RepID=A0ABQ4Y4R8_9ASTR
MKELLSQKDGSSDKSTAPRTVFRDDETIAEFLVSMSQNKAKQKDKQESIAEEVSSDAGQRVLMKLKESLISFVRMKKNSRKVQEDWEAEEEMKTVSEEEAIKAALIQDFNDIQARIEADRLLAARLQEEERETFIVEERAKFLYDTIAAQRRFLAQQRGKKHADLKNKNFEEIQHLYKEVKTSDKNFIAIGSAEDKRHIKEINEDSKDPKKKRLKKRVVNETPREEDTAKVPVEQESEVTRQDLFHLYDLVMKQNNQQDWEIVSWRLYEACGVCILELKDGTVIYMLVERRYPLSKELLQRMLDLGLEVEEESTAALHLVRFIKQQLIKRVKRGEELASPGSNSSWLSIHLVVYNEELAIPEQTATGKGISNPLMAGSLPKTTKPT